MAKKHKNEMLPILLIVGAVLVIGLAFVFMGAAPAGEAVRGGRVRESVTCVFKDSNSMQKCYSDRGDICSGVEKCRVRVRGKRGQKIMWESSCTGTQYTKIDRRGETIVFNCKKPAVAQPAAAKRAVAKPAALGYVKDVLIVNNKNTYTVAGKQYTVEIKAADKSTNRATFSVNGEIITLSAVGIGTLYDGTFLVNVKVTQKTVEFIILPI